MSIKTATSFCKENWQVGVKTEEVAEISPIKITFNSKKLETNTVVLLLKSAKKLDGEETRIILLNGCWYFLTLIENSASARKYHCSTSSGSI